MLVGKDVNRLVTKGALIHLAILLAIALGIGVYLIATTVLIAQDGVLYIEQAQKFSSDPVGAVKEHPFGYSFLIFVAHKFVSLFSNSSSAYTWIYTAQSITLLCRLLALIALYFIGKLLVDSKNSFCAILILVILPYPARFGSDVLRDWPHILFLATGFFFLLWGARQGKWWMFGVAGLAAGLGHMIRPECAQLVLYGILWLLIRLFLPKRNMNRFKLVCALFILIAGFAVPAGAYMKVRGKVLPHKLKMLISSSVPLQSEEFQEQNFDSYGNVYTAASLPNKIVKAIGRLIEEISDNLFYFFVPALLIGIYYRFRRKTAGTETERFFVPAFTALNIIMLILLHCNYEYISRRHSLPLVVFTIFYVPIGLQVIGKRLESKFPTDGQKINPSREERGSWFLVLLLIGTVICMPKLLRPMRIEKQGYRIAAKWLKENTAPEDVIAVPDGRISYYAERKGLAYEGGKIPAPAVYAVKNIKSEDEKLNFGGAVREEVWFWVDKQKKKRLVIYKMI